MLFGDSGDVLYLASAKNDFALAILLDQPDYSIPKNWETISLSELVDDGIGPYERNRHELVMTRLSKRLFEHGPGSIRWKTLLYLEQTRVKDLGDVYGALNSDFMSLSQSLAVSSCGR
jgi:hypothetical protein